METYGFGEVAERLRRSTVHIRTAGRSSGAGSGVVWDSSGLVVTNAHVARHAPLTAQFWDGRAFPARVTATDARRDLASLKVDTAGLPAATPGDSSALRVGELVIAVGNPLGFIGALTTGVVHAIGALPGVGRQAWVQADIRLAPGNSGGPLADAQGRVMGINTMIYGGLALAVPSNAVSDFLRRGGSRGSLGIVVQPVALRPSGPQALGLLVLKVIPGSAAEAGSLLVGDVLTAANGNPFQDTDDLAEAIDRVSEARGGPAAYGSRAPGVLHLQFLRGDRSRHREVAIRLAAPVSEAA